jgi:hypothetical protein
MQAFLLPKWLLKHIERSKSIFFWKGKATCAGGSCLVNWETIYLPKIHGGLGIQNLETQNIALLLRWLWEIYDKPDSNWALIIASQYGPHSSWDNPKASFFFKDILKLQGIFQVSTEYSNVVWRWQWETQG